ncbi:hypothetical protein [Planctomicrobium sp. SH664]|uniref:hypothetical protein n=1 Tax=Planctomicrobium sp. SH664 TaxID=3448125 RepID=UPI003F5B6941
MAHRPVERRPMMTEGGRSLLSLFCAAALGGMAALFYWGDDGLLHWLSLLPAVFCAAMLLNALHALFGTVIPSTTVRLPEEPLRRDEETAATLVQAGPISLASLRVNLVCEVTETPLQQPRRVSYPVQQNLCDFREVDISQTTREFAVPIRFPEGAEASSEHPRRSVRWRLEVWGQRPGAVDYQRSFELEVV